MTANLLELDLDLDLDLDVNMGMDMHELDQHVCMRIEMHTGAAWVGGADFFLGPR